MFYFRRFAPDGLTVEQTQNVSFANYFRLTRLSLLSFPFTFLLSVLDKTRSFSKNAKTSMFIPYKRATVIRIERHPLYKLETNSVTDVTNKKIVLSVLAF